MVKRKFSSDTDSPATSSVASVQCCEDAKDDLGVKFRRINSALGRLHEHVSPKFTSKEREQFGIQNQYGGITGTLTPSSLYRITTLLQGDVVPGAKFKRRFDDEECKLPWDFTLKAKESVFCDIGSGTGRPVFYLACADIKASIGFDIDPMQVFNSRYGKEYLIKRNAPINSPLGFFHANVQHIVSLFPVTHAFAFLGYPDIIDSTVHLVATTSSIKVFIAIVLHEKELRETGILEEDIDGKIIILPGVQMPGGNSYSAFLIPMTKRRCRIVAKKLKRKPIPKGARIIFKDALDSCLIAEHEVEDTPVRTRQSARLSTLIK